MVCPISEIFNKLQRDVTCYSRPQANNRHTNTLMKVPEPVIIYFVDYQIKTFEQTIQIFHAFSPRNHTAANPRRARASSPQTCI